MTRWERYRVKHANEQRIAKLIELYGGNKLGPIYFRLQFCDPLKSDEPHLKSLRGRGVEISVITKSYNLRLGWSQLALWNHNGIPLFNWNRKYKPEKAN